MQVEADQETVADIFVDSIKKLIEVLWRATSLCPNGPHVIISHLAQKSQKHKASPKPIRLVFFFPISESKSKQSYDKIRLTGKLTP